jgi:hypothetical protein
LKCVNLIYFSNDNIFQNYLHRNKLLNYIYPKLISNEKRREFAKKNHMNLRLTYVNYEVAIIGRPIKLFGVVEVETSKCPLGNTIRSAIRKFPPRTRKA